MMPEITSRPYWLSVLIASIIGSESLCVLRMALRASASGVSNADENANEQSLAHQREDFVLLGDIERRLAGKLHRIAALFLPRDQIRQHVARGFAIADEIVVDK